MKLLFIYRHGRFSCIDPRHWGHTEKIGSYPLLYPPPAPLGLGLHSAENLQSAQPWTVYAGSFGWFGALGSRTCRPPGRVKEGRTLG